ncbi:NADH-quinone oxidoreductase subunit N [Halonotius pteroides]|uniref:NADH-quinone oxidoreductase subunit N n=1 Tax=Halonotius pteroides TaxID=268735 RepID=A0A3A6Q8G6_9EURY|nr:NADH-quinone oxidoreductase subunit N [Halonotius pteroides]RJX50380.1 NADH-quinone oxidoreductase subunit N [Halonotius pteroides]
MSLVLQGTTTDWVFSVRALLPVVLLALTGLAVFGINSLRPDGRDNKLLALTSIAGTLSALAVTVWYLFAGTGQPTHGGAISLFSGAIVVDGLGLFFTAIFTSVATLVIAASYDYFETDANPASFYSLLLLSTTAMGLMAVSNSLVTVFVSLEMTSLPSYALVAYLKDNRGSVEAGLKYFLIGAVSSAVLAFGISLVYAATGSLLLPDIAAQIGSIGDLNGVLGIGIVMIAGGVAFKTASVPFHFWAPEAYEGAPAPVSAFLSSASKAAGFAVGFRVFATAFQPAIDIGIDWGLLFGILAVVTMVLGNFAAATQTEVKRMLAYSSIGHAGYALIGLAAVTAGASATNATVMGAAMAHLFVYGFMNTGAFLFIAMVERWGVGRTFEDYAGLAERAPMASLAMAVFMFSLAGLPLFGGFFSKYFLFLGAINAGFWWLAAVGAVTSTLSLFYYSRVVKALWLEEATTDLDAIGDAPTGLYAAVIVAGVVTVLLLPGFGPVIETAEAAAAALFA